VWFLTDRGLALSILTIDRAATLETAARGHDEVVDTLVAAGGSRVCRCGTTGTARSARMSRRRPTMNSLWSYRENVVSSTGGDVVGYDVDAIDGSIGKVDESSVAADNSHIVVDTGWWIFGKKRLIPAGAVTAVDHDAKTVTVSLTKDQIKDAPDYDENALLDDVSRDAYDNYYGPYGG
jgi:hypothetical protein